MTAKPGGSFVSRPRTIICAFLLVAAVVTALVLIGSSRATARPTPTPRPRPIPSEILPQTWDIAVGQGGALAFMPSTLTIYTGDFVRWTWLSDGHSVTSGLNCTADGLFCSPGNVNCGQGILSNYGTVYEIDFGQPGTYYYFCAAHCASGMTGVINVVPRPRRH